MKQILISLLTLISVQVFSQQLNSYNFSSDGFAISAGFPSSPSKDAKKLTHSNMLTVKDTRDGITYVLILTNTSSEQVASQSATATAQKLWDGAKQKDSKLSSSVAGVSSTQLRYVANNGTHIISQTFYSGLMMVQSMVMHKNQYPSDYIANNFFSSISFSANQGGAYNNNNNYNNNPNYQPTPAANGHYEKNQRVEVWDAKTSKWYGAIILKANYNKTFRVSYDGYAENYDEDISADRIRNMSSATAPVNIPYIQLKRFGKTTVDGNLMSGYTMDDLSWASTSQLACWPSIRDVEFQGKHAGYWFDLPEKSVVKITVTPKRKDRRINIYGYAGFDLKTIPPQLPYTNICEASHPEWIGQPNLNEPSKPQTITFNTTTRRTTIYFAVAGARNVYDGDYTISIDVD